jgi:hypothetical protein
LERAYKQKSRESALSAFAEHEISESKIIERDAHRELQQGCESEMRSRDDKQGIGSVTYHGIDSPDYKKADYLFLELTPSKWTPYRGES